MSDDIGNRHAGDLGGRLAADDSVRPVGVRVTVADLHAGLHATQHTAWMLINLLARLVQVVGDVIVDCPRNVALLPNVIPGKMIGAPSLRDELIDSASGIGGATIRSKGQADRTLFVGPEASRPNELQVFGAGWVGGIARVARIEGSITSALPFGPYVAACLGAGAVFTDARLPVARRWRDDTLCLSAWTLQRVSGPWVSSDGPTAPMIRMRATLAGVGAVGSTWVHAIACCPGVLGEVDLVDNDDRGIEATNLNRYPLFGRDSLGRAKASEAARLAARPGILWRPFDREIESMDFLAPLLLSAVDADVARRVIQRRYPARILSASTHDLRAELLRAGPPGVGACLQCDTQDDPVLTDEQVRAAMQADETLARRAGVTPGEIQAWKEKGGCGEIGGRILGAFRSGAAEVPRFAVGFVSVMAGVLLAAQSVKELSGNAPALSDTVNRSVFQFFEPFARTNAPGFHARATRCPACAPGSPQHAVWLRRFHSGPSFSE